MFEPVKIPESGYQSNMVCLLQLSTAIGRQDSTSTEIFVRGEVALGTGNMIFAGCIIAREGGDDPDHDVIIYGEQDPEDLKDLVTAIYEALDELTNTLDTEMTRILG